MKILHINSSDHGGAGKASLRLHDALLKLGVDSTFMSLDNSINDNIVYFRYNTLKKIYIKPEQPTLTLKNYFKEKFTHTYSKKLEQYRVYNLKNESVKGDFEIFTSPITSYDLIESPAYKNADIIHLHWVADYLDYESFFAKNKKPIIWTFHDENPYLGAFHYGGDDKRNKMNCKELNDKFLDIKFKSISLQKEIVIISPSEWLARKAKTSLIFKNREVKTIYNPLDLNQFKIFDQSFSREVFNIDKNKVVFMFASQQLSNKRKGFQFLEPLINSEEFKEIQFLVVGSNSYSENLENVKFIGAINDDRLMALAYSAADYFILPSVEDNLPNTMIEAIACGTPVIGFPIGDNKKIISEGNCGIVADEISTIALRDSMLKAIKEISKFNSKTLNEYAKLNFDSIKQAKLYINEYNNLLK